jgi:aspartyl-tRNA(Asn)/glutamyl-tRNA(Gln) amidotransferase subunit A
VAAETKEIDMSDELCFMTATELRRHIAHRELSPVEVTRAVLERAERLQPELNCFITICADEALAQAKDAEQALMRGEPLGLLHGVPYTCKDVIDTQGIRTTYGSLLHAQHVPARDAEVVARLRRQGAVLVGKTTTPEFAAKCLTDAPLFGRTRNAWSAAHSSGGSSGGTAVAVAASIAPIGVATDGGGSTRIPAACNGIVGLKQSSGLVPHSQADDVYGNVTFVTPMSRTVADTALMLQAMAGEDAGEPWSTGVEVPDYVKASAPQGDLRGKRVLYCVAPEGRIVSAEVEKAFRTSLAHLQGLGADLIEMPGNAFDIEPMWRVINHTVWRTCYADMAREHPQMLSATFQKQMALVTSVSGVDYQKAMFERTRFFRFVQSLLRDNDLVAMPTLTRTALPIGQDLFGSIEIDGQVFPDVRPNWFPWTMPFNLTGHPAISLPNGFGALGLPIGIQLVGRLRGDAELLRCAALLERSQHLLDHRPALG